MPMRRQALRSIELLATFHFFSLILIFSLALPSLLVKAEPVPSDADGRVVPGEVNPNPTQVPDTSIVAADSLPDADTSSPQATQPSRPDSLAVPRIASTEPLRQAMLFILLLTFLNAATFIAWRYSRRDIASPRRIGRRI
jgi:hypothetical protein